MSRFEELTLPRKARLGWYVVAAKDNYRYLHNDTKVHNSAQGLIKTSGYFPTEADAYRCAECYYFGYSVRYPSGAKIDKSQNVNDGSQVMNFWRKG